MTRNNKILITVLAIVAVLGIIGTLYFATSNQEASVAKLPIKNTLQSKTLNPNHGTLTEVTEVPMSSSRKKQLYLLEFSDGNGGSVCYYYSLTPKELKNRDFNGNYVGPGSC